MPRESHFIVGGYEGDTIEPLARSLANDAILSPHPDHYVTLYARVIQIVAMHKRPPPEYCPDDLRENGT